MYTTLEQIFKENPCNEGRARLEAAIRKPEYCNVTVQEQLPLRLWLADDSSDLETRIFDIMWAFCAVDGHTHDKHMFVIWLAQRVRHLMTKKASLNALGVVRRYADGGATPHELHVAYMAALDAENAKQSIHLSLVERAGHQWSARQRTPNIWLAQAETNAAAAARTACLDLERGPARSHMSLLSPWNTYSNVLDTVICEASYLAAVELHNAGAYAIHGSTERHRIDAVALAVKKTNEAVEAELHVLFTHTETGIPYVPVGVALLDFHPNFTEVAQ